MSSPQQPERKHQRQLSFSDDGLLSKKMRAKVKAEADKFAKALPDLIKSGKEQEYYSAVYQEVLDRQKKERPYQREIKRVPIAHPGLRQSDEEEISSEQAQEAFLKVGQAVGIKEFDLVLKRNEKAKDQEQEPQKKKRKTQRTRRKKLTPEQKKLAPLFQSGFHLDEERQMASPPTAKVGRRTEQLIGNFSAILYERFKSTNEAEVEAMVANGTLFVSANKLGTVEKITEELQKQELSSILKDHGSGDAEKVLMFVQAMQGKDDLDLSRLGRIDFELSVGPILDKNQFIEVLRALKNATRIVQAKNVSQAAAFLSSGSHAGRIVTVPGEENCHAEQNLMYAVILADYKEQVQIAGMRRACTGCWMSYKLATEIGDYNIVYNPLPGLAFPTTVDRGLANIANALKVRHQDLEGLFTRWLTGYNQFFSGKPLDKPSSGRQPAIPISQYGAKDSSRRSYSRSPEPEAESDEQPLLERKISHAPRRPGATSFSIAYNGGGGTAPNPISIPIKQHGEDITIGRSDRCDVTVDASGFPETAATLSFGRSGIQIKAVDARIIINSDETLRSGGVSTLTEGDEFTINRFSWIIKNTGD